MPTISTILPKTLKNPKPKNSLSTKVSSNPTTIVPAWSKCVVIQFVFYLILPHIFESVESATGQDCAGEKFTGHHSTVPAQLRQENSRLLVRPAQKTHRFSEGVFQPCWKLDWKPHHWKRKWRSNKRTLVWGFLFRKLDRFWEPTSAFKIATNEKIGKKKNANAVYPEK